MAQGESRRPTGGRPPPCPTPEGMPPSGRPPWRGLRFARPPWEGSASPDPCGKALPRLTLAERREYTTTTWRLANFVVQISSSVEEGHTWADVTNRPCLGTSRAVATGPGCDNASPTGGCTTTPPVSQLSGWEDRLERRAGRMAIPH